MNLRWRKLLDTTGQVISTDIAHAGTSWHCVFPDVMHHKEYCHFYGFPAKNAWSESGPRRLSWWAQLKTHSSDCKTCSLYNCEDMKDWEGLKNCSRLKWSVIHSIIIFLEKAMATHSSTLAWKIQWMEEPGRLQSMGSWSIGHDWATSLSLFTLMHWRRKWQPTPVVLPGECQGWQSLVGCRLWGRTESDTTEAT